MPLSNKKTLFLILVGVMFGTWVNAQPRLKLEKRKYTFSILESGKKYYHKFKISNTGSSPLFISFVRMNDPKLCTLDWPRSVIQPGEEAFITVHIDLTEYTSPNLYNTVMVYSNCPSPDNFKTLDFSAKVHVAGKKE